MANDITITIVGNLTADPELRYTPSGTAVARFTVASTPRYVDRESGKWRDGEPVFMSCTVWRELAENVTESMTKGARVIVTGRLRQRSYDTDNGKRTVFEMQAEEVGPSLRFTAAKLSRLERPGRTAAVDERWTTSAPTEEPPF